MDFSCTKEQQALQAEIMRFAQEDLCGEASEFDQKGEFPREKWTKCGAFGLPGLLTPAEHGGRGLDVVTTILALESLGFGCEDNGLAFAVNVQILIQQPIIEFGNEEQKQRYLPQLASGSMLGAYAFTEPHAGSDLYSIATEATKVEGGYRLSGTKALVTMGPLADVALVFATINPDLKQWGLTAFLVELNGDGVRLGPAEDKMGLRSVPLGEIVFDDCFVPAANLLGNEGAGLGILTASIEWERCLVFASQLGALERQLQQCVERARTREQFGQPIGKFQSISNRIADMKLRLETSRLLLYRVAWCKDAGEPAILNALLAKLQLTESFVESSLEAIRIHGGIGYLGKTGVERDLRDAIGGIIYAGTSDIQRNTIAKLLGL